MNRTCLKCKHVNPNASGEALEICPACGAIYSRVEAVNAMHGIDSVRSQKPASPPLVKHTGIRTYAEIMRNESLYPTFRGMVNINGWLWNFLAAVTALGAVTTLFFGSGRERFLGFVGGAAFAFFLYVMDRFFKELSLMLADLSDASVRTSAMLESKS